MRKRNVLLMLIGLVLAGVLVASGTATAVNQIGSRGIKRHAIISGKIAPNAVNHHKLSRLVSERLSTTNLSAAALEEPVTIENIGGLINDRNTDTGVGLTLPAGTYAVTVDGALTSNADADDPEVDVWPQLSLWIDRNGDGEFTWQTEGDISPNALMPTVVNRHISVNGTTVITLEEETDVGLLAFGYASDGSSMRSGEIDVVHAALTATPLTG